MQTQPAPPEGDILWSPAASRCRASAMHGFMQAVEQRTGRRLHGRYEELWLWSVQHIEEFWAAVWEHFLLASTPYQCVLESRAMPGARWFPGARLNFAQHVLGAGQDDEPALLYLSELKPAQAVSRRRLRCDVLRAAAGLRGLGVVPGDRVAGCLPNGYEAAVGFLAAAAVGAIWAGVSPVLGPQALADRLVPLKPKVLLATHGYLRGGQAVDLRATIRHLWRQLPGPTSLVAVGMPERGDGPPPWPGATRWSEWLGTGQPDEAAFRYEPVDSQHPLWAWISAGTSGPCKTVMHSHTGVLLEALVLLSLHHDLRVGKRLYAHADTGDLLWHLSLAALATGASVVLHDGHATYPRADVQWKIASDLEVTHLATTPAYVSRMRKAGLRPRDTCPLGKLESVILTGAPASPDLYTWLHAEVRPDLWVAAAGQCADIAGAFMAPCPLLPVRAGRLQCRALGHDVQAWSGRGEPLVGAVGELVCVQPLPSMPLGLWADPSQQRRRAAWFDAVPGVWHQGDLLLLDACGGGIITGRCASSLARGGRRLGTQAFYEALDGVPGLDGALVVQLEQDAGDGLLPLFVKLSVGAVLDDAMVNRIRQALVTHGLAAFQPDCCRAIPEIPCGSGGDRMELPVRRILMGCPVDRAACMAAVTCPEALAWCQGMARSLASLMRTGGRP